MGPSWDLTCDLILSKSILGILGLVWTDSASAVSDGRDASRVLCGRVPGAIQLQVMASRRIQRGMVSLV